MSVSPFRHPPNAAPLIAQVDYRRMLLERLDAADPDDRSGRSDLWREIERIDTRIDARLARLPLPRLAAHPGELDPRLGRSPTAFPDGAAVASVMERVARQPVRGRPRLVVLDGGEALRVAAWERGGPVLLDASGARRHADRWLPLTLADLAVRRSDHDLCARLLAGPWAIEARSETRAGWSRLFDAWTYALRRVDAGVILLDRAVADYRAAAEHLDRRGPVARTRRGLPRDLFLAAERERMARWRARRRAMLLARAA